MSLDNEQLVAEHIESLCANHGVKLVLEMLAIYIHDWGTDALAGLDEKSAKAVRLATELKALLPLAAEMRE